LITVGEEQAPADPLFDDRPSGSFAPLTWQHRPSVQTVSIETETAQACQRLLANAELPPVARAALLGGRSRARLRMWRLDDALTDCEAALALDPSSAGLHLLHADILACYGRNDEADTWLQQASIRDPASTLIARSLGLLRFQQGSLDAAAEALAVHLAHAASEGTGREDATLPLLRAVAAGETGSLSAVDDPGAPWIRQLEALLVGRIDRATLLARAQQPQGAAADTAACTAWFYLGQRSLARGERERAGRDFLAALRTGATSTVEYRLAAAALIRLSVLSAASLPGLPPP